MIIASGLMTERRRSKTAKCGGRRGGQSPSRWAVARRGRWRRRAGDSGVAPVKPFMDDGTARYAAASWSNASTGPGIFIDDGTARVASRVDAGAGRDSARPARSTASTAITALAAQVGRRAPVGGPLRGRHVHERAAPGHPLPPGGDAARPGRAERRAADGRDPRFHRARVRRAHRVILFHVRHGGHELSSSTTWTTRISASATRRRTPVAAVSSYTAR